MNSLKDIFKKADINVSLLRINIGVKNETLTVNDETYNLQNDKQLTFLYRVPKIILKPLDYQLMTDAYKKVLSIPLSSASKMARLTMGYSFAFQMFGYLYWDNNCEKEIEEILSDTDKKIICELAKQGTSKVKDIRKALDMSSQKFSVYRDRLSRKGLIDTSEYGNISILLPRFHEYVNYKLM